ncbi:MAG: chemotaxis protein CheW [Hyphomicrobiales bacterium]|nr:chemotaxis protein CheW [Hyphomicrobiales bacterium]
MTLPPVGDAHGLLLSLRVGNARFSLGAHDAAEVLRAPSLMRVPNAPAALAGVTSLRGAVLPVFSLARLLDLPDATDAPKPFVIVLAGAAMGLGVDEVETLRAEDESADIVRPLDLEALARGQLQASLRTGRVSRATASVAEKRTVEQGMALLGFDLAGQSFAFPLTHVDEVLAAPDAATRLPHARAGDLGVIQIRGALLPLLSLRALLGLPKDADDAQHVIVARLGQARIGLVVDRLTSVQRAREEALAPVPAILNRGGGEARIAAIHRGVDGRLVSILSPERLFADPDIANELARTAEEAKPMPTQTSDEHSEQIVVFRLGHEEYGLPIAAVDEITRLPENVTRVPRAPDFVIGVMNLRGRIVPLIDQGARFGLAAGDDKAAASRKRVIVTQIDALVAGFIVDDVREILSVPASRMRAAPSLASVDLQTFDRVAMLDVEGRMILMVDPRELLNRAERDMLAHESWKDLNLAAT